MVCDWCVGFTGFVPCVADGQVALEANDGPDTMMQLLVFSRSDRLLRKRAFNCSNNVVRLTTMVDMGASE